jgi:putative glycosyltransferase (TIGR04372 family)
MSDLIGRFERSVSYRFRRQYKKLMANMGASNFKYRLHRVRLEKNINKRLALAEDLQREFPEHPFSAYEVADALYLLRDPAAFDAIRQYRKIRITWIQETGLENLGIDFLPSAMVTGAFGHSHTFNSLVLAIKLGVIKDYKPTILLPSGTKYRNRTFFNYFKPFISVIEDQELCDSLAPVVELLTLPMFWNVPLTPECLTLPLFHNFIEKKRAGRQDFYLELWQDHVKKGKILSKDLGIPSDAWHVVLHVREPGYRGEKVGPEDFRNGDPISFIGAIKMITDAGGWVIRMGDPAMTPLPKMPKVIDYACVESRNAILEIYLSATARFCIGSSSGYFAIPTAFGVPVLLANALEGQNGYQLTERDLFLPKLCRYKENGEIVGMGEMMKFPTNCLTSSKDYVDKGIDWFDNDMDDIERATREMLERTDGMLAEEAVLSKNQQQYINIANNSAKSYKTNSIKIAAPLPESFLLKYPELLN